MRILLNPQRNELQVVQGGGCLAAIGAAFGIWCCLLGSVLYFGWSAGDFSLLEVILASILLIAFAVTGFTIATYRDRICLNQDAGHIIRKTSTILVPLRWKKWAVSDFQAVELRLLEWHRKDQTESYHVIRLMPSSSGPRHSLQLGSGKAGSRTAHQAKQIADFLQVPIMETTGLGPIRRDEGTSE